MLLFKTAVISCLLLYAMVAAGLYAIQRSLIYPADTRSVSPENVGRKNIDVIHVTTADGLKLEGWFVRPASANKPIIVLFHGNGDHHAFAINHMDPFIQEGYGVLLTEYRGYAGNPGKPSEEGLYKDGRAWIGWLLEQGILSQDIILYGQSVGSGIAVQMALEFPHTRALLLYAPFTSLPDVARADYFFLPLNLLMRDQYRNIDKIAKVAMPVFIINGVKDTIVKPVQGKMLYDAARTHKAFIQIEGAGHADIPARIVALHVERFLNSLNSAQ